MTPETTARPSCWLIHTNHPLKEGTSGSCGHHQPAFGGRARPGRSFHGPYSGHILDFNPLVSTGLLTSIWTGQRRLLWDFGLYSPSSGVTRSLDSGLHFDIFKFPFTDFSNLYSIYGGAGTASAIPQCRSQICHWYGRECPAIPACKLQSLWKSRVDFYQHVFAKFVSSTEKFFASHRNLARIFSIY